MNIETSPEILSGLNWHTKFICIKNAFTSKCYLTILIEHSDSQLSVRISVNQVFEWSMRMVCELLRWT